ncbi:MAG: AAA domain-containing protein [Acidobacteriota bacterium]
MKAYADQLPNSQLDVTAIDSGQKVQDRYLHPLTIDITDDDLTLADDTPVEFRSENGPRASGQVAGLSRDESVLYVAFEHRLSPADAPGKLAVNRKKAWFDLAIQLALLADVPAPLKWLKLGPHSPSLASVSGADLASELRNLAIPWWRLLWGPPGSGKTYCLARLAAQLASVNPAERVLIVAPSNAAVDAAVLELVRALEEYPAGPALLHQRQIYRYGYPKDRRVLNRPEVFGPPELAERAQLLRETHDHHQQLVRQKASEDKVFEARTLVQIRQKELRQCMAAYLAGARIVATTIAAVALQNSPVPEAGKWGTVIVDEASMTCGAMLLLLARLAETRFLVAGDPRQLAPIFQWQSFIDPPDNVNHWVAKDAFEWAGISQGAGLHKTVNHQDARLARIILQRRSHPAIWSLVSHLYPQVSSEADVVSLDRIAEAPPIPGKPVVLLDLSHGRKPYVDVEEAADASEVATKFESACQKAGRSWRNPPTAMLAIDVAREIRSCQQQARIAIITPYRGQVRLLRRWLAEEGKADPKFQEIEVGTVHSFQGAEAHVVIFDLVDGPPRAKRVLNRFGEW